MHIFSSFLLLNTASSKKEQCVTRSTLLLRIVLSVFPSKRNLGFETGVLGFRCEREQPSLIYIAINTAKLPAAPLIFLFSSPSLINLKNLDTNAAVIKNPPRTSTNLIRACDPTKSENHWTWICFYALESEAFWKANDNWKRRFACPENPLFSCNNNRISTCLALPEKTTIVIFTNH